jgi:hypothetical protein
LNLGEVGYDKTCEAELKVFNFSSVTIHFFFFCDYKNITQIEKSSVIDIKILPLYGTINPGKGKKILVTLIPKQPGFHDLIIKYLTRTTYLINGSLFVTEPKILCKLTYTCYLPTLQVN